MLNSGKKFQALRDKKINILTLVLSAEKEFLNETKNHNPTPPLQVEWSVPNCIDSCKCTLHHNYYSSINVLYIVVMSLSVFCI